MYGVSSFEVGVQTFSFVVTVTQNNLLSGWYLDLFLDQEGKLKVSAPTPSGYLKVRLVLDQQEDVQDIF
jgi:hypothetical protein